MIILATARFCPACGELLIERDWYELKQWLLTDNGLCCHCGEPLVGVFDNKPGNWGSKRQAVRLSEV